jgi:hydrogenase maturation protein HypF
LRLSNHMELKKINLPFVIGNSVLSLGAQNKNTLCFAKGNFAYLTRPHPDLNNPGDFSNFLKELSIFLKKGPKVIACDLHPEYQSTKEAFKLGALGYRLVSVQHHHAHVAACMAENGIKNQKVIGVAFDGTGLGSDNTLWGGEFLICNYHSFERKAHLKEIPLLGSSQAIKEPWRLAAAWLYPIYKEKFLKQDNSFIRAIDKKKWRVLKNMHLSGVNSPLTSSMGRLFDAVASLVLKKYKAGFEAELALELEQLALSYRGKTYPYLFRISRKQGSYIIDPSPFFKEIIKNLKVKTPKEEIAFRFHLSIARMIEKVTVLLRKESGINKVALCGGVFQNSLLAFLGKESLQRQGFTVLRQEELSPADSSISLGQAAVAHFKE